MPRSSSRLLNALDPVKYEVAGAPVKMARQRKARPRHLGHLTYSELPSGPPHSEDPTALALEIGENLTGTSGLNKAAVLG